jgi:uncharacterized protein YegL
MAKRLTSLVLLVMISFAFIFSSFCDETRPNYNRYNIVLVVDASGSMAWTDAEDLRFEAIAKFVALLAESGNRIGTVVFSHEIILQRDMTDVDSLLVKREIVDEISAISPGGFTNIGGALHNAIDLLDEGRNPDLDSIILFLSDGNTEMPSEEQTAHSLSLKADAIERARESGYVIHSVSLDYDSSASPEELRQISAATGGLFEEVKTSADLEKVYALFYRVIFNSLDFKNNLEEFPDSGVIEGAFRVPIIGVEEVNIVLTGTPSDYNITAPDGTVYLKEDLSDLTFFNVIKFVQPAAGEWNYSITGIPGDEIRIELIFNTNLQARLIAEEKEEYLLNDAIIFTAQIIQNGEVAKADLFEYFTAELNGIEMPNFVYEFIPVNQGAFTFRAVIEGEGYFLESAPITVNVQNTPPEFNENIEFRKYLLPFSENIARIDLSHGAIDPLNRGLRYEVISSAFNPEEFAVENAQLVINSYSLNKGSFTLRAFDPLGGYADFNVFISTVNVTMWTVILLGSGLLLVIAILAIIAWVNINKRFYGTCYVRFYDSESDEYFEEFAVTNPKRGKRKMPHFKLKNTVFDLRKCFFQASGKRHVYLRMNEVVFALGIKDKKFKIDGEGFEVQVSKQADSTSGIIVRFETHRRK